MSLTTPLLASPWPAMIKVGRLINCRLHPSKSRSNDLTAFSWPWSESPTKSNLFTDDISLCSYLCIHAKLQILIYCAGLHTFLRFCLTLMRALTCILGAEYQADLFPPLLLHLMARDSGSPLQITNHSSQKLQICLWIKSLILFGQIFMVQQGMKQKHYCGETSCQELLSLVAQEGFLRR